MDKEKVVAIKDGFFGGSRQRVGSVFDVPKGTKGTWFVAAPKAAEPAPAPPAAKKATAARNQTPPAPPAGGQPGGGSDDLV